MPQHSHVGCGVGLWHAQRELRRWSLPLPPQTPKHERAHTCGAAAVGGPSRFKQTPAQACQQA